MNKEHLQRVNAWNEFKKTFQITCNKIDILRNKLESEIIYHSSDFDNRKKSQLVLAFTEKPINVYIEGSGELSVEKEWGCRLIYQLEHNGSVSVRL